VPIARGQREGTLDLHGRANIGITINLYVYGHLMPGNEAEAAALLNAYLCPANEPIRVESRRSG
jgi:hypothetical protein